MISVLSHLRQLSGSKIILFFLLGMFAFSCGTSKKKQPVRKKTPSTTYKKPTKKKKPKVDTVEWTKVDETKKTDTKVDKKPQANNKDSYQVTMFMPLKGRSSYVEGESKSLESYINYYAGVKMALKDLEAQGANIQVNVYDDEIDFNKTIYAPSFKESDVIIGPRKKDKLKKLAGIGKRNKILVVSPWFTNTKMTTENPYYLQLNPYTTYRYEALLTHAKKHFSNDNIIVLQRENTSDKKRAQYFRKLNRSMDGANATPLEIFTVSTDSLENGETAFDELIMLEEQRDIAVILPNWSSADEYYIYSCLRKLSVEKRMNNITVYAMSKVLESDLINFELYKNLNVRIAAEKYIDREDSRVINFKSRYFQEYNAMITNDAIEGYDMMTFIGENLMKYGNTFPSMLNNAERMSQLKYNIQGKHSKADIGNEKFDNVQYYENIHVDIIEFQDLNFVRRR